jgi:hypothetical protein
VQHGDPIWCPFSSDHGGRPRQPVEICFGSFMATSTVSVATTSPVTTVKIVTAPAPAPALAPVSDLASETHPPKPYDIVQGMELKGSRCRLEGGE